MPIATTMLRGSFRNSSSAPATRFSAPRIALENLPAIFLFLAATCPLISERTLNAMIHSHREHNASLTLLTALLKEPTATVASCAMLMARSRALSKSETRRMPSKRIEEVNAGSLRCVRAISIFGSGKSKKRQRTRRVLLARYRGHCAWKQGERVATVKVDDAREVMGINTREELALMEKTLQERINRKWMDNGVTLKDPDTTYIDE